MKRIAAAGNTLVPVILALEHAGFVVTAQDGDDGQTISASRGDEVYVAGEPEAVLGLIKLVEMTGWDWRATDAEIEEVRERHPWLG